LYFIPLTRPYDFFCILDSFLLCSDYWLLTPGFWILASTY